ncbi:hypothetical protein TWF718_008395 [Orbilia javanica]|uniref:F-box domain-containing protein n=1 Tax=Orbilia javanica TaxID=47235 RepID=A0AAN8RCE8_9PEZI
MASIKTLAPEIIFSIVRYLSCAETLNLGLSCKGLYPMCYRALWTSLSVVSAGSWNKTWPGLQIRTGLEWKICETIKEYWLKSPGLRYTKHFDVGRHIYDDKETASILMQLLEDGKLAPSCINISFYIPDITVENHRPMHQRFKEYTESKTLKELKLRIYSALGSSISELVDLTKITTLELAIPDHGYRAVLTNPDETVGRRIKEITSVIEKTINLRYFSWKGTTDRRSLISLISEDLEDLQMAFTNLRRLETLKIECYMFHPSFFLVPPETVKYLILNCLASPKWWKEFAACPLTNVRDLRIYPYETSAREMGVFISPEQQQIRIPTLKLEKVAVRNLKVFLHLCSKAPEDLGWCILKNNPGLRQARKIELANHEAKRLVRKPHKRFEADWQLSRCYIEDLYIAHYLKNAEPMTEQQIVEGYCEMCILGEIEKGYVRSWERAKERALMLESKCTPDLKEMPHVSGFIDHAVHFYTLAFMSKQEDVDEDEFKKECVRLSEEDAQTERKYHEAKLAAKHKVIPVVNKFRQVFDGVRKKIVRDVALNVLDGLILDEMALMKHWVQRALSHFQDFGAAKLNISGGG